MRILNVSAEADTAGSGWLTAQAFAEASSDVYRATRAAGNYLAYPVDLPWSEARETWRRSDVVMLQQDFAAETLLRIRCRRPLVLVHHGTRFRRSPGRWLRAARVRRIQATVSTLDLWLLAPDELIWSPIPVRLKQLRATRLADPPVTGAPLRVVHAPTNRAVKGTDGFLRAVGQLARETPAEAVLVEHRPWSACLELKATADVLYDQLALGIGMNAVEAMAMGIPVIAGGPEPVLAELARRNGGVLPFAVATDDASLLETMRRLVDPAERAAVAARGTAYVERFHSPAAAVAAITAIATDALSRGT